MVDCSHFRTSFYLLHPILSRPPLENNSDNILTKVLVMIITKHSALQGGKYNDMSENYGTI